MESHIDHHFDESLTELKQQILLMGRKVESMVADCIGDMGSGNNSLSTDMMERDRTVNALEMSIDEQCIELLVRYQPAASDLRFITRGFKIVTDLERIGDLAVNIAQRVTEIQVSGKMPIDLSGMSSVVESMLRNSLDAFVSMDASKAVRVLETDDQVDEMTEKFVTELLERSTKDAQEAKVLFPASSIVRYLERIADHSTNIAELAIFMVKGRDVRHGKPR